MVSMGVTYSVMIGNVGLQQFDATKIYNPPYDCSVKSANFTGYHAVSAVGWGHDEESATDYAIMRNSWGEDWGNADGYFKVALKEDKTGVCNMYNLHQNLYDIEINKIFDS